MSSARVPFCKRPLAALLAGAALLALMPAADARVTRIVVDATGTLSGQDIPYETITGRAFGELDPSDSHNELITSRASSS